MDMIWRCLYDMDMMWRCLCSEKNKMLEETSLARSLLGPGPGSTSTVDLGFREEGEINYQGCFFLVQTLFTRRFQPLYKTYFTKILIRMVLPALL